ncbi:MAG: heme-binding protein [Xenococcaceae cyanobacterium MO_188.B19]|nr:heme-binding protein [Xenococcaceae cyanobacterium MO_188.B19]
MDIQYTQAQSLVEAAMAIAQERQVAISVAVVDSHGDLVSYGRMDMATLQSGVLAQAKAYTAARERIPSSELGQWAQKTGKDMGYWVDPKITGMAGGVPIMVNDQVLGGIGASGLSEEEDEQLVQAALARCYP